MKSITLVRGNRALREPLAEIDGESSFAKLPASEREFWQEPMQEPWQKARVARLLRKKAPLLERGAA
jgi:hypothetical protein